MVRSRYVVAVAVLVALVAVSLAVRATGDRKPVVRKVACNHETGEMMISGKNFCFVPVVRLSTTQLEILSVTLADSGPDVIVAQVPDSILDDPATYLMTLECGNDDSGRMLGASSDTSPGR